MWRVVRVRGMSLARVHRPGGVGGMRGSTLGEVVEDGKFDVEALLRVGLLRVDGEELRHAGGGVKGGCGAGRRGERWSSGDGGSHLGLKGGVFGDGLALDGGVLGSGLVLAGGDGGIVGMGTGVGSGRGCRGWGGRVG